MPAHQRYRSTTGSVAKLRGHKIGHSTFQTVAPPLPTDSHDHYFCSSRAYWKSCRNQDRPRDGPMLGPGWHPGNCPTDTTTDRTTDTRKLEQQLGPSDGPSCDSSCGPTDDPTVWTGFKSSQPSGQLPHAVRSPRRSGSRSRVKRSRC
jgi:hypothetical protein